MSVQNLIRFVRFASQRDHLAARLRRPIRFEDFRAIAAERGFSLGELSAAEICQTLESIFNRSEEDSPVQYSFVETDFECEIDMDSIREAFCEGRPMFYESWTIP